MVALVRLACSSPLLLRTTKSPPAATSAHRNVGSSILSTSRSQAGTVGSSRLSTSAQKERLRARTALFAARRRHLARARRAEGARARLPHTPPPPPLRQLRRDAVEAARQ